MTGLNTSIFFAFNSIAGQSASVDKVIVFFADYLAYILVAVFITILFFQKTRSEKIRLFLSAIVASIVGRGIVVEVIRFFYHHPRPFVVLENVRQLFAESSYSFPSGHATFFFALSTVLYCRNKYFGATFFVLSLIMGLARISAGVHYPLDILGGAIFGVIVGFASDYAVNKFFSSSPASSASSRE